MFTHHLISALRGAADRDADGRVTLHEAYEYAYSGTLQTSSRTNERLQHPTISFAAEGAGPLVLTRIAPARSLLTLPAARDEQYVVFEKAPGRLRRGLDHAEHRTQIALPAGQFLVYRRSERGYAATEVTLPFGGTQNLSEDNFSEAEPIEVARKGGSYGVRTTNLNAGLGMSVDASDRVGPFLRIAYARAGTGLSPTLGVGFGFIDFATAKNDAFRSTLELIPGSIMR